MEYLGLPILSIVFYKQAKEYEKEYDLTNNYTLVEYEHRDVTEMIEKYYLMAVELNNPAAMGDIAMFYEKIKKYDLAIKYYLMAVECDEVYAIYNLADLYYILHNYELMKFYYTKAITEHNDLESMYAMVKYFNLIHNIEECKKYYILAAQHPDFLKKKFPKNIFNALEEYYMIMNDINHNNLTDIASINLKEKISKLKKKEEIAIYNNKITLFKNLNNIIDCVVCYENVLNINLFCGHCVCVLCYTKLYESPCPLCRI
jgi:tetratricopeptide (TPR) repeat protein